MLDNIKIQSVTSLDDIESIGKTFSKISRDDSESGLGIIPRFKSMGLLVLLGLKSFGIPFNSKNFFKSQLISEWLFDVLNFPKKQLKNFMNFCPRIGAIENIIKVPLFF